MQRGFTLASICRLCRLDCEFQEHLCVGYYYSCFLWQSIAFILNCAINMSSILNMVIGALKLKITRFFFSSFCQRLLFILFEPFFFFFFYVHNNAFFEISLTPMHSTVSRILAYIREINSISMGHMFNIMKD